ncbi:hypothetical protein [Maricaulis sp.]|uniref:hypothetical protein n=1 Tax=Maricaulis sp. TaxID=1486257 RepID=UPI0026273641|nr:hypothetical protein [Maricaulis sp.]
MTQKREKQSESLEIRLGFTAKREFMDACRERGLTASEVVREFVETYPVEPEQRGWSFPTPKLPEPAMKLSAVMLLSAVMGTSAVLPTAATADRNDPEASFAELDADNDGQFVIEDLYRIAGLTPDGRLGQEIRDDAMNSISEAMAEFGPAVQEDLLSPDYVERVLQNAEDSARSSVTSTFAMLDDNDDGTVTRREFMEFAAREMHQFAPRLED